MTIAGLLGATGVGAAQAASSSDGRSSSAAQERAARDGGRGLTTAGSRRSPAGSA